MATQADTPPTVPIESKDFASNESSDTSASVDTNGETSPTPDSTNGLRIPTLKPLSDQSTTNMTPSSTISGNLKGVRGPVSSPAPGRGRPGGLSSDLQARVAAFAASRQGAPPGRPQVQTTASTGRSIPDTGSAGGPRMPGGIPAGFAGGLPAGFKMPPNMRPQPHAANSTPILPKKKGLSLAERRGGMKLPGGLPGSPNPGANGSATPGADAPSNPTSGQTGSLFDGYKKFVDTQTGTLNFDGRAKIHGDGIDFSNGKQFSISLDEVDTMDELGKGNYGTVYKVRHARPRMRKPGQGLGGVLKSASPITPVSAEQSPITPENGTSGIIMAMKEIRLELDEAKFAAIIMELDILHRCVSPYIIDFYGAFFQEGAVYICIEFMDGGSIDKIYGDGVPENVLRKITYATTRGLKELKDVHNIIHRDVKPTNILVNTKGQVKICDFGVSGNLVASIAKTNIGCQSYMAPERISGGGIASAGAPGVGTYSVQSDIWSLGLSIIECAMGRYPYPSETYNNIFSQLSAIVDGEPPDLPEEGYSAQARDFVHGCLNKIPKLRPTYGMLLAHPWLAPISKPSTITEEDEELAERASQIDISSGAHTERSMGDGIGGENKFDREVADWCISALERKRLGKMGVAAKPALHAAPLDTISPSGSPAV